jgi:hypothetical protein
MERSQSTYVFASCNAACVVYSLWHGLGFPTAEAYDAIDWHRVEYRISVDAEVHWQICTLDTYEMGLKALALPRASHSGEIALVGSHRMRPTDTLVVAPVRVAHAIVIVAKSNLK